MTQRTAGATSTDPGRTSGFAEALFTGLPDHYDVLAEVLSFGQNRRWRAAMVDAAVADRPASVLDVATGPAGVALALARRSDAEITGVDLTAAMIRKAAGNVAMSPVADRIRLAVGRGEQLPFPDATFDAVTFTYLLRYVADPAATLAELVRVLAPGGVLANLEFAVPAGRLWHPLWWVYTRALLPAAGLVTGGRDWWAVGRFLGPSISGHYARYPLEWHREAWHDAGLRDVRLRRMSLGGGLVMSGRRA